MDSQRTHLAPRYQVEAYRTLRANIYIVVMITIWSTVGFTLAPNLESSRPVWFGVLCDVGAACAIVFGYHMYVVLEKWTVVRPDGGVDPFAGAISLPASGRWAGAGLIASWLVIGILGLLKVHPG